MSSLSHIPAHIMTGFDTNRTCLINFMSLPPTLARIYIPHLELCHTEHCHFECIVNGRNSSLGLSISARVCFTCRVNFVVND